MLTGFDRRGNLPLSASVMCHVVLFTEESRLIQGLMCVIARYSYACALESDKHFGGSIMIQGVKSLLAVILINFQRKFI